MKKQIIILVISLVIIVYCGIWELNYLDKTSMYLKSDLNSIKNYVENDNFDMALMGYNNLQNTWDNMSNLWNIFINHERIDYLEENMTILKTNLKINEKDETIEIIDKLDRLIFQITDKQKPTFEHVL